MPKTKITLTLFLSILVFYLPVFLNPALLLGRGNDLEEQFWPIFYFIKTQFQATHSLPFWNNLILSGTPLLPDPQFSLFYPANWFFLFIPTDPAFIVYFLLHSSLAIFCFFLLARRLNLSPSASLLSSLLYTLSPKFAGFLTAGHPGLFAAHCWLPLVLYSALKIYQTPKLRYSTLAAIALSGIFFTHTVIFILALVIYGLSFPTLLLISTRKSLPYKIFVTFTSFFLLLGLIAVSLLPQLQFLPNSTRSILLKSPATFPQWHSLLEYFSSLSTPWWAGLSSLQNIDTEKWLFLGLTPILLASVGFTFLQPKIKLVIILASILTFLISVNNLSPLFPFLIHQPWFILMRVSTRVWFVPLLSVSLLAAFGFQKLSSSVPRLSRFLAVLAVFELLLISWLRITTPISKPKEYAPLPVYQYLSSDTDKFRVYCTTRCLSQKLSALAHLELIEGYNTFQQINYYQHSWQLTGAYWNYYTLAIPPPGSYLFDQPQPDAKSLGAYNTKYVISPYKLTDPAFILVKEISSYYIYQNSFFRSRAYSPNGASLPITKFAPNHIRVQIPNRSINQVILAEVYSPGWAAYLNGQEKVPILETPNALRATDILSNTSFVDFKYQPSSFSRGIIITILTVPLLLLFLFL